MYFFLAQEWSWWIALALTGAVALVSGWHWKRYAALAEKQADIEESARDN